MFRYPVKRKENSIEGFRSAAVYDPLTEDVLQFAMRAARKKSNSEREAVFCAVPYRIIYRNSR